jgi:hypothetical protein
VKPGALPLETAYVHDLMARATPVFPDVRMFRRNTGIIQLESRVFRAGIPGQCDLYAIGKGARHFEIECKRFGKLSEPQERWRDWCRSWGIPWLLLEVAKGEVPAETVHRWIDELRQLFS